MSTVPFTNIQYICKARVKDASQLKNIIFLVGRGEDCTPPPSKTHYGQTEQT